MHAYEAGLPCERKEAGTSGACQDGVGPIKFIPVTTTKDWLKCKNLLPKDKCKQQQVD